MHPVQTILHPVQTIIPQVKEAVQKLDKDDHVIIQCLDNTAYYSRTEEGGDIPVRRYIDGEFHVEGDLVLASKERQYLMFECILPLLQAVGVRNIILVTPGPRYLYESCCALEEHAPNRMDENFEETLRSMQPERVQAQLQDLLLHPQHKSKGCGPFASPHPDGRGWGGRVGSGPRPPSSARIQTPGRYAGDRDGGTAEQEQEEGSLPEAAFCEETKGGGTPTQLDTAQPCDS